MIPGTETSLLTYYDQKYGIKIQNRKQPLIVANRRGKDEDPELLIPELCLVTGIPDHYDEYKRRSISQTTIQSAPDKLKEILDLTNEIENSGEFSALSKLGLEVNKKANGVEGAIIPSPVLMLGENKKVDNGRESNFQLFSQPLFSSREKLNIGLLYTDRTDVEGIERVFTNTCRNLRVKFNFVKENVGDTRDRKITEKYCRIMEDMVKQDHVNILFIVIPPNMKTQYKRLKDFSLHTLGVVSQVAVESTLNKKNNQSIITKLLLQINAKVGNILWSPSAQINTSGMMIVGIDNSCAGRKNIVSLCGTYDDTFTSVYSSSGVYEKPEDKFLVMKQLILEAIGHYVKVNQKGPR